MASLPHGLTPAATLPAPPEPCAAKANDRPEDLTFAFEGLSDEPVFNLSDECWDITAISPRAALEMLIRAIENLAEATGDVPPTPPVSRPATPRRNSRQEVLRQSSGWDTLSRPMTIGSPEAHPSEPMTVEIGAGAEDVILQRIAISRRFFSRTAPTFTLNDYLNRLHQYCPHSPGVYLAAAVYCHRLCVLDAVVPATKRTIHRLSLASIRVAAKALEDNKWTQERVAIIGGISRVQLMNLELTLCYLLDFELGVRPSQLAQSMYLLQQAAHHEHANQVFTAEAFKLRLTAGKNRSQC